MAKIDELSRISYNFRNRSPKPLFIFQHSTHTLFVSLCPQMPTPLHTHTAKQNYLVCLIHSTQCLICLFFVQKEIAAYWEILLRNGPVFFFGKNFIIPQKAITILKFLSHRLLYNLEKRPSPRTNKIDQTEITLSLTLPRLTD